VRGETEKKGYKTIQEECATKRTDLMDSSRGHAIITHEQSWWLWGKIS